LLRPATHIGGQAPNPTAEQQEGQNKWQDRMGLDAEATPALHNVIGVNLAYYYDSPSDGGGSGGGSSSMKQESQAG